MSYDVEQVRQLVARYMMSGDHRNVLQDALRPGMGQSSVNAQFSFARAFWQVAKANGFVAADYANVRIAALEDEMRLRYYPVPE